VLLKVAIFFNRDNYTLLLTCLDKTDKAKNWVANFLTRIAIHQAGK
jgi:hypothetical protein